MGKETSELFRAGVQEKPAATFVVAGIVTSDGREGSVSMSAFLRDIQSIQFLNNNNVIEVLLLLLVVRVKTGNVNKLALH